MAARKSTSSEEKPHSEPPHWSKDSVKDSAEQIWQAGLGAFAKAQQEGGKLFNTLVQDGMALQKQAQAAAQEQFKDASERLSGMASKMGAQASEPLGKLENIFEDRVAKALQRLGVPTAQEFQQLQEQVAALTKALEKSQAANANGAKRASAKDKDAS